MGPYTGVNQDKEVIDDQNLANSVFISEAVLTCLFEQIFGAQFPNVAEVLW
jgi:hypothetical protein